MRTNKRARVISDGELPDDVDWNFVFKIEHEEVFRVCPPSNPANKTKSLFDFLRKARFSREGPAKLSHNDMKEEMRLKEEAAKNFQNSGPTDICNSEILSLPEDYHLARVTSLKQGYLEMGNTGLMLNIITPLQKFSKGGTTHTDVFKQRYFDLYGKELSEQTVSQIEDVFTRKKEDRVKLQQVCLLVETYSAKSMNFIHSTISDVITNSKSKECGPLQLHDINPSISCCNSETKIFILSFFKLVSDVRANFVLYDPEADTVCYDNYLDLFRKIVQPKECTVFCQTVVIFRAPRQDPAVIEEIEALGLHLRLTAFRPHDKKMSSTSFKFNYVKHEGVDCTMCEYFAPGGINGDLQELPIAKPGVQRRVASLQDAPKELLDEPESTHFVGNINELIQSAKAAAMPTSTSSPPISDLIPTSVMSPPRPTDVYQRREGTQTAIQRPPSNYSPEVISLPSPNSSSQGPPQELIQVAGVHTVLESPIQISLPPNSGGGPASNPSPSPSGSSTDREQEGSIPPKKLFAKRQRESNNPHQPIQDGQPPTKFLPMPDISSLRQQMPNLVPNHLDNEPSPIPLRILPPGKLQRNGKSPPSAPPPPPLRFQNGNSPPPPPPLRFHGEPREQNLGGMPVTLQLRKEKMDKQAAAAAAATSRRAPIPRPESRVPPTVVRSMNYPPNLEIPPTLAGGKRPYHGDGGALPFGGPQRDHHRQMMETKRHRGGPLPGYDINREAEIANELRRREEQERSDLSRQLLMEAHHKAVKNLHEIESALNTARSLNHNSDLDSRRQQERPPLPPMRSISHGNERQRQQQEVPMPTMMHQDLPTIVYEGQVPAGGQRIEGHVAPGMPRIESHVGPGAQRRAHPSEQLRAQKPSHPSEHLTIAPPKPIKDHQRQMAAGSGSYADFERKMKQPAAGANQRFIPLNRLHEEASYVVNRGYQRYKNSDIPPHSPGVSGPSSSHPNLPPQQPVNSPPQLSSAFSYQRLENERANLADSLLRKGTLNYFRKN